MPTGISSPGALVGVPEISIGLWARLVWRAPGDGVRFIVKAVRPYGRPACMGGLGSDMWLSRGGYASALSYGDIRKGTTAWTGASR
ncbi:hypothetical protein GCM10009429_39370 [Dyella marensis]